MQIVGFPLALRANDSEALVDWTSLARNSPGPNSNSRNAATFMATTETNVLLEPITHNTESTLRNLFELYAYDFSDHMPLQLKPSGRFELGPDDDWWKREEHFAYLIKLRGELAGFVLVRRGSRVTDAPEVMDVGEFFILRGIRGKGVGRLAAHALFSAFSRKWEIRVRRTNAAALQFWSQVVESWVGRPVSSSSFSVKGVNWDLLQFAASSESPNASQNC